MPFPLPFALPLLQTLDMETLSLMSLNSCKLREPELTWNAHAIPSMSHLTASSSSNKHDEKHMMNAYLLDFYIHGQVLTLALANGIRIRRGDIWYLLQDFSLALLTVKMTMLRKAMMTTAMLIRNHHQPVPATNSLTLIGRRWWKMLIGGYTR